MKSVYWVYINPQRYSCTFELRTLNKLHFCHFHWVPGPWVPNPQVQCHKILEPPLEWVKAGSHWFLHLLGLDIDLCPLRQMCKVFSVSPTYCLLHFLHSIRYTRLLVLQVAAVCTLYDWPVIELWNVSVALT